MEEEGAHDAFTCPKDMIRAMAGDRLPVIACDGQVAGVMPGQWPPGHSRYLT